MEWYNFPRKATSSQMQCGIRLSGLSVGLLKKDIKKKHEAPKQNLGTTHNQMVTNSFLNSWRLPVFFYMLRFFP